jgi:hypothetical protein
VVAGEGGDGTDEGVCMRIDESMRYSWQCFWYSLPADTENILFHLIVY